MFGRERHNVWRGRQGTWKEKFHRVLILFWTISIHSTVNRLLEVLLKVEVISQPEKREETGSSGKLNLIIPAKKRLRKAIC